MLYHYSWLVNGEELFDALVVANGHYNVPHYPPLLTNDFAGVAIHSKEYRSPSPFAEKRVLLVGGGRSGRGQRVSPRLTN